MPGRGGLTARLLAFNLLLVFLPVAGLLFLGPYERQLLATQERAMVQQGRLLAAALSVGGEVSAESARRMLGALDQRTEARLRVLAPDGHLLADSSLVGTTRNSTVETTAADEVAKTRDNPLYALGALPFVLWNRWIGDSGLSKVEPGEFYSALARLQGPEIDAALGGRYGAATRIAPGPSRAVILYSALPIRVGDEVTGVVLVSQSTARILAELYEIRLTVFLVFLASVASAVALSLYVAGTIARPLRALAGEARELVDGRGRLRGRFRGSERDDEIGDLARALDELTRQLGHRQAATEAFAADVSHELKNPLASIRGATELGAEAEKEGERRRFTLVVEQEVARMERILAGVREIVHLDAPSASEPVDLAHLVETLAESFALREAPGARIEVRRLGADLVVNGVPERLAALIENLLDNAQSFTPAGNAVEVELDRDGRWVELRVADRGPGIPEAHVERIFQRFFTWRPAGDSADRPHSGLGLAIVRAVAEAHGGTVSVANRAAGGACFVVRLPAS